MSAEGKLREIAAKIADRHAGRVRELENRMREIEARKAEVQAKLDAAKVSGDRLAQYPVKLGRNYACPQCAIDRGKNVPLTALPGGGNSVDKFRCRVCGLDVELPA